MNANAAMTRLPAGFALPARDEIEEAAKFLAPLVPPTPQFVWPQVAAAFGAEVWLKHENHTPIGAFKARSAAVYFRRLMEREPGCPGVITATRGNHGQAVGLAARRFKLPATIYVPHGNSVEKNAAMRALGATLVEHGQDFQEAREEAARAGAQHGLQDVAGKCSFMCVATACRYRPAGAGSAGTTTAARGVEPSRFTTTPGSVFPATCARASADNSATTALYCGSLTRFFTSYGSLPGSVKNAPVSRPKNSA